MEKVATSKMRKAQMRMASSRPYAERIRQVIGHLAMPTRIPPPVYGGSRR